MKSILKSDLWLAASDEWIESLAVLVFTLVLAAVLFKISV